MALARLKDRRDFLAARHHGRKWATPGLVLQVRPWRPSETAERSDSGPRYGLTASRKVGSAVSRNRARRRLRALAEEQLAEMPQAHDFVLIAREQTVDRPFTALRGDLRQALRRLGLRRGDLAGTSAP